MERTPPSRQGRQISSLVALIVAVSTPATLALSWYHLTGDPTFRPLALTVDRLAAVGIETGEPQARAVIRTDGTRPEHARILARRIHAAFYGKGLEASVVIVTRAGSGPMRVTYEVGANRFGPFAPADAATGIQDSVQALTLLKQSSKADRQHSW